MNLLNEFEAALLLLAKRRYRFDGDRVEGALVVVAHISGIPMEDAKLRDVAQWLLNVLVWTNKGMPAAVGGRLAPALLGVLDGLAEHSLASWPADQSLKARWHCAVGHLMGQVAITQISNGVTMYIEMPTLDPDIQAALDRANAMTQISVPTYFGEQQVMATPEQRERARCDPDGVFAELLGFPSAAEYDRWCDSAGSINCAGRTATDQACPNPVPGQLNLDPATWMRSLGVGGVCKDHQ